MTKEALLAGIRRLPPGDVIDLLVGAWDATAARLEEAPSDRKARP
jgi:hypothetical protein